MIISEDVPSVHHLSASKESPSLLLYFRNKIYIYIKYDQDIVVTKFTRLRKHPVFSSEGLFANYGNLIVFRKKIF